MKELQPYRSELRGSRSGIPSDLAHEVPARSGRGPDPAPHGGGEERHPELQAGHAPHVLIVGGFLTEPFNYWPLRHRLLARGAASVTVAPLHLPDWLAAGLVGFGPMLARLGGAIRRAQAAGGGQPLLVVAHSGGGVVARLAMSEVPFRGRWSAVAASVGALVTLGTPHGLAGAGVRSAHSGVAAARFLDRHGPGRPFTPTTAYLTVGSDFVRPGPLTWWDGLVSRGFAAIVGPLPAEGGDGIVSVTAAHLAGAEQLTFHDVRHGHIGRPWYGDDEIIDRWWPRAVELWRGALAARRMAAVTRRQPPPVVRDPRMCGCEELPKIR